MKYVYKVDTTADGLVGMFTSMKKAEKQAMWEVENLYSDGLTNAMELTDASVDRTWVRFYGNRIDMQLHATVSRYCVE
jgi:hypothetical protein